MSLPNERGFTLVEVLIAIVILSVGLVPVVQAMGRTQQAMNVSQNLITASLIAEERIREAELRLREEKTLRFGSDQGEERFPGRTFSWNRNIAPFQDITVKDQTRINQVTAKVSWKESGKVSTLELPFVAMNREKKGAAPAAGSAS